MVIKSESTAQNNTQCTLEPRPKMQIYSIENNDKMGRFLVAKRDIKVGELIMRQSPLIVAPKAFSLPLCLSCYQTLTPSAFICTKCSWPLCSAKCQNDAHEEECQILANFSLRPHLIPKKQCIYAIIALIRALLLKKNNKEKFAEFITLQSHLEEHKKTEFYKNMSLTLIPLFLRDFQIFQTNAQEILNICSVFDTNAFEMQANKTNIRAIFLQASLMSHNCTHNTRHSFEDSDLVVEAAAPIKKGEIISTTYTQTLWNTSARREHLRKSKMFTCECFRCKDPTELGLYVGSILCQECEDSKLVLALERWQCEKCGYIVTQDEMRITDEYFKNLLSQLDKNGPEELEQVLQRFAHILHETNTWTLQIKYALTQIYGHAKGFEIKELSEQLIERKIDLVRQLVEVAAVLEPGQSRFRGMLLMEWQGLLAEIVERKGLNDYKTHLDNSIGMLKEAANILKMDKERVNEIIKKRLDMLNDLIVKCN